MSEIIYRDYKIKYRHPANDRGIREKGWYIYSRRNESERMKRISGPYSHRATAKLYINDLCNIREKMKKFGWR